MKSCKELEELIRSVLGDEVVGFFERKVTTSYQEVRVFTPVYSQQTKSYDLVN
jgi:hypothetical protein